MIDDIFKFADDFKQNDVSASDILVSYDVTALFTNVPVDGTISYIVQTTGLMRPTISIYQKNSWSNCSK